MSNSAAFLIWRDHASRWMRTTSVQRVRSGLAAFVAIAVLLCALGTAAAAPTETHSYITDSRQRHGKNSISDDELFKLIKENLGTNYQNLQIVISSCYSGGFATQGSALPGNWSVATATDQKHTHGLHEYTRGGKAGRNRTKNGAVGLQTAGPPDPTDGGDDEKDRSRNNRWAHGWGPYYTKALKNGPTKTSKMLADAAAADATKWYKLRRGKDKNENPQYASGGTGDKSQVHDGVESNHAIIWSSITSTSDPRKARFEARYDNAMYGALEDASFDMTTIDYASDKLKAGGVVKTGLDKQTKGIRTHAANRGAATKENLTKMLQDLKPLLDAKPGKEKVFLFLHAHGNREKRKADKKNNPLPGTEKQGRVITPGESVGIELDESFVESFFEDVATDDPLLRRTGSPVVVISTAEEFVSGPVDVALDGVPVGSIDLQGINTGATYEVTVDDAELLAIHSLGLLEDDAVEVSFDFSFGSFRIATEWDFDLSDLRHYGVGLAGPPIAEPEVAAQTAGRAAAKVDVSMVRCYAACPGITFPAPNVTTFTGLPACAPPFALSPMQFGRRGSCRVKITAAVVPCSGGLFEECHDAVVMVKCSDILEPDGLTPVDTPGLGQGWALNLLARFTAGDPQDGGSTLIDFPMSLPFSAVSRGKLKLKASLNGALTEIFGPFGTLPAETMNDMRALRIIDPFGECFATPGSSTRPGQ